VIHLSKPASVLLHVDCVSVVMIISIDKHTAGQNIMHELITVEVLIRAKFIQTVLSS